MYSVSNTLAAQSSHKSKIKFISLLRFRSVYIVEERNKKKEQQRSQRNKIRRKGEKNCSEKMLHVQAILEYIFSDTRHWKKYELVCMYA